jgi:hypothetical protein
MKKLILLLPLLLAPAPVMAQQTNIYEVCRTYQENYAPGYYDQYGNYVQGNVRTEVYNTRCGTGTYYRPNNQSSTLSCHTSNTTSSHCATSSLGAILGGVAGYAATPRVADRWYMIPLGILGGGVVGNALC